MMDERPKAVAYLRISKDSDDRGEGVARQREDTIELANRFGLNLIQIFEENDVSASTNSKKARPQYDEMIGMVRRGEVDVVLGYSLSRITRRVREWLDLIDLAKETGVRFQTCLREDPDLTTANGRERAIAMANRDQYEAEIASERLIRQKAQRAAEGRPQGGRYRLYGYSRDWEPIPNEVEAIIEVFERRRNGQSITSIARWLDETGRATSSGARWTSGTLSRVIENPTYCGLRSHRGEVIGKSTVQALIPEDLWRAANAQKVKRQPGTNARRWLLSGILRCTKCGGGMTGNGDRAGYRCNRSWNGCGHTTVQVHGTDSAIASLVLAREALRVRPTRPREPSPDLDAIDHEISVAQQLFDSGDLSLTDWAHATKVLRARRAAAEEQVADSGTGGTGLIFTLADWVRSDLSERRALLGRHLDHVRVLPAGRGGKRNGPGAFDVSRLVVRWQDGSEQPVTEEELSRAPRWNPAGSTWSIPAGTAIAAFEPMQLEGDGPETVGVRSVNATS